MKPPWKIFLILFLFFGVSSCQKFITPEDLGMNVLESFQKNDVELALGFIMYEDDYDDFFSNSDLSQKEKDRLIAKHTKPDYVKERVKRFKNRFVDILNEGKNAGITWSDTKFEYIKGPTSKSIEGLQYDEIYVFFSFDSAIYKLRLDDCYKCSRGWLMSDEPSFEGKVQR